jgi:outer membrane protein OmpA-like peptidoglycan-associated protein
MNENLLELLKNQLTGPIIGQIAHALGLPEDKTRSYIEAALAVIFSGALQKASRPGGAEGLMKTLKDGGYNGDLLQNLGSMLGSSDGSQGLTKSGNALLDGLFGDKLGSVAGALSSGLGLSKGSANSLLAMAAPLVMSQIGKFAAAKGFSAAGLTDLLLSQKSHLQSASPAGLANALGLSNLADLGKDAQRRAADYGAQAARAGEAAVDRASSWSTWALPAGILALLLLALGIYALRQREPVVPGERQAMPDAAGRVAENAGQQIGAAAEGAKDSIAGAAERTRAAATNAEQRIAGAAEGAKQSIAGAAERTGAAAANAGREIAGAAERTRDSLAKTAEGIKTSAEGVKEKLTAFTLPGGLKVDLPENSALAHFATFLQTPKPNLSQVFALDSLELEPGTTRIAAGSMTTMDILAKILKAFPGVNIKLLGHAATASDSVQQKAEGFRLATEAKHLLVERGVDSRRIDVEGAETESKGGKLELQVTKL